jgi:hypothetical protein
MSVFITYAREDEPIVGEMRKDIGRMHREVWIDEMLLGGQQWWDVILGEIRKCDIYIFAFSEQSIRSKPCRAELLYATQLGKVIVPVKVGDVDNTLAPPVIANAQVVDFRQRSADAVMALRDALDAQPPSNPLPDPLPVPPPVPTSYLNALADEVDAKDLSFDKQVWLVGQLRAHLAEDEKARTSTVELLRRLRRRADLAQQVAVDIDGTLQAFESGAVFGNPWAPPSQPPISTGSPGAARSRRGLVAAVVAAAVAALGGGIAFGVSQSDGPTPITAPTTNPTTPAPSPTTPPTTHAPTVPTPPSVPSDHLQAALLTADDIGATDGGAFVGSMYPCTDTDVFSGMPAFFGPELDFSNAIVGSADVAFTDASSARDFFRRLPETGCDHFQHPNGDIESTGAAIHSTDGDADLKQYAWAGQAGHDAIVGLDTYISTGRVVGFVTCMSTIDTDAKELVSGCTPIVHQFVGYLSAVPD